MPAWQMFPVLLAWLVLPSVSTFPTSAGWPTGFNPSHLCCCLCIRPAQTLPDWLRALTFQVLQLLHKPHAYIFFCEFAEMFWRGFSVWHIIRVSRPPYFQISTTCFNFSYFPLPFSKYALGIVTRRENWEEKKYITKCWAHFTICEIATRSQSIFCII